MDKAELIITALQQRIGEISATHELDKAILRAEYTELKNDYDKLILEQEEKKKALNEYSKYIDQKED
jgi:hypothetical protein